MNIHINLSQQPQSVNRFHHYKINTPHRMKYSLAITQENKTFVCILKEKHTHWTPTKFDDDYFRFSNELQMNNV